MMSAGAQPRIQCWGPIPWSRVLLPFYRKKLEVYPVWCSRLHNRTLFIKKLRKNLGVSSKFFGGPDLPDPPVVVPMYFDLKDKFTIMLIFKKC